MILPLCYTHVRECHKVHTVFSNKVRNNFKEGLLDNVLTVSPCFCTATLFLLQYKLLL